MTGQGWGTEPGRFTGGRDWILINPASYALFREDRAQQAPCLGPELA